MYEDVDFLQQSSQYYFIDYIPYDTNDPSFLELEEYFENTYIGLFAEKISSILLKIMYYTPCQVYLARPENPSADYEYDRNIRSYPPEKWIQPSRKSSLMTSHHFKCYSIHHEYSSVFVAVSP